MPSTDIWKSTKNGLATGQMGLDNRTVLSLSPPEDPTVIVFTSPGSKVSCTGTTLVYPAREFSSEMFTAGPSLT